MIFLDSPGDFSAFTASGKPHILDIIRNKLRSAESLFLHTPCLLKTPAKTNFLHSYVFTQAPFFSFPIMSIIILVADRLRCEIIISHPQN